jgi:glycosyltransferase involved in cell wall biosynthesis
MKVCHVITRMIIGGAQENTLFSIYGLMDAGHQVELVTGPSPGPEGELLKNSGKNVDLKVVECPDLVRNISPLQDWKAYRFLLNYFRSNKFDVVHTHSSKAGIIGRLAAHAAGVPLVVHTVHGLAFHRFEKPWKNWIYILLEKIAAAKCHKIYAVAQAMIDQCLAAGIGKKEQYQVVYSGMELEPFLTSEKDEDLRKELNIPESAKVLGTVARLFPLKGYEELFK